MTPKQAYAVSCAHFLTSLLSQEGFTPLHKAAIYGATPVVQVLVADPRVDVRAIDELASVGGVWAGVLSPSP